MIQIDDNLPNPDPYYIRNVTEFSDVRKVVCSEDIYTSTGIKLVAQGTPINRSFYDKLMRHKLAATPIDKSLSVEGALTARDLWLDTEQLFNGDDRLMQRIRTGLSDLTFMQQRLSGIVLNPALAFKLTLAREKWPVIYQHSLRVAAASLYLASQIHLSAVDQHKLASAAIFHDLGEMHINPEVLDKQFYAHPIISYLLLREYPEYHPDISEIVLDHHERLDGSGYPRHLSARDIHPLAQILAVAEVTGSLCSGSHDDSSERLNMAFKFNSGQFRSDLAQFLLAPRSPNATPQFADDIKDTDALRASLDDIAGLLAAWDEIAGPHLRHHAPRPMRYVADRLDILKKNLFDAGFDPASLHHLTHDIETDRDCLLELNLLVREARWQVRNILGETLRQWPEIDQPAQPALQALHDWIERTRERF